VALSEGRKDRAEPGFLNTKPVFAAVFMDSDFLGVSGINRFPQAALLELAGQSASNRGHEPALARPASDG
jgi:hypothetical protein